MGCLIILMLLALLFGIGFAAKVAFLYLAIIGGIFAIIIVAAIAATTRK